MRSLVVVDAGTMIRRRLTAALVAMSALPSVSHPLVSQAAPSQATVPAYRARILGVFDAQTGAPIEGASVTDMLSRTSALTTATGTVSLIFLPDSGGIIRIQKIGYQPATRVVAITPVDTVPITLALEPIAQTLPTVVTKDSAPHYVSPGLHAFEERRRLGFGKFVTEADLRKSDNRSMTNVIRSQNIKVDCSTRFPFPCFAASTRAWRGSCLFDVYLDGALLKTEDRDLEAMRVNEFSGVEIYSGPATVPTQYNKTGSSCGVLLLWSRER